MKLIEIFFIMAIMTIQTVLQVPNKNQSSLFLQQMASGICNTAKQTYVESLITDHPLSLGIEYDVSLLHVSGIKPISGSFIINENGKILLKQVEIEGYICNGEEDKINCYKVEGRR